MNEKQLKKALINYLQCELSKFEATKIIEESTIVVNDDDIKVTYKDGTKIDFKFVKTIALAKETY